MMKAAVLVFLLVSGIAGYAQSSINNYKYVIVPAKFDFSKIVNQYGINTTTKQWLEQKGFVAILDNDTLPPEVAADKCKALKADVTENNNMFVTKLTLVLKDCQGNIIFQSKEGRSREKELYAAYTAALKDAFTSLAYKYDSTKQAQPQQAATAPAVQAPVATAPAASAPSAAMPAVTTTPAKPVTAINTATLYAQVTATGYQLVDTAPKKVLTLLKTSVQDYFIAQAETGNGIVFKRNGEWFFEYYEGDKLISRKLEIKF